MSEFLNDILRFCSLNTFDGSINVFNNFSKRLSGLRSKVAEIGANVAKEVFEAGSEAVKSVRDSLVSAFGIDPSKLDAGNATNNMSMQSKGAQGAMSGMPTGVNDLMKGGSNAGSTNQNNIVPTSQKMRQRRLEEERLQKQIGEQRLAVGQK